jgi:transposase
VLELLKETKTLSQLASEYRVHANLLREWKHAAIKGLPDVFEKRDSVTEARAAYERQIEDLYAEIGRLTTPVNFLKKSRQDGEVHSIIIRFYWQSEQERDSTRWTVRERTPSASMSHLKMPADSKISALIQKYHPSNSKISPQLTLVILLIRERERDRAD